MLNNLLINVFLNDENQERIADQNGLFLVKLKKSVKWYARFKHLGILYQKDLGPYPQVTLADARSKIKVLKSTIKETPTISVRQAAEIWLRKKKGEILDYKRLEYRVKKYIITPLGGVELEKLTAPMVINAWKEFEIEQRGYTLKAISNYLANITKLMVNIGKIKQPNNIFNIASYYTRQAVVHRSTIDPQNLSDFFTAYFNRKKTYSTAFTLLKLSFYTLLRQQELVYMRWDWINGQVIEVPAEVMKMKRGFRLPITSQIEEELKTIPKISEFVFPAAWDHTNGKTINKETLTKSLNKIGFKDILSAHGIRAIGSTWLAQQNFKKELREACLAHKTGSIIELSYQNYDFIEERSLIMQEWCNFVEKCLKEGQERAKNGDFISDLNKLKNAKLKFDKSKLTLEDLKLH